MPLTHKHPWRRALMVGGRPDPYEHWLTTSGSLTKKLQAHCENFRVEPLFEGWRQGLPDEIARIGVVRGRVRVREVLLYCDGIPVVFAHSVLAAHPRHQLDRVFRGLGRRALGSLLFVDPRFTRGGLEYARLDARHPLYRRASRCLAAAGKGLPLSFRARRAVFHLLGKRLLVTEVFLPTVLDLQRRTG